MKSLITSFSLLSFLVCTNLIAQVDLGNLSSNPYLKESSSNKYGAGSKYNSKSINNPYGICTQSVFGTRGSVRDKVVDCVPYYDYSKMKVKILRKKAKEKKLLNYSTMKKKELVKKLEKLRK